LVLTGPAGADGANGADGADGELNNLTDVLKTTDSLYIGQEPASVTGTAQFNISVGATALDAVSSGDSNVAIGYDAGTAITSAKGNVVVGKEAGSGLSATDGTSANANSFNTIIGNGAGTSLASTTVNEASNNTIIGNGAQASAAGVSNEITLGNDSVETLRCGTATITTLSDRRDKTNIKDNIYGIDFIEKLRTVEYTWKTREGSAKDGSVRVGFIAQELKDAMKEGENSVLDLVHEVNPERLEIKSGNLVPILVKAVQELQQQVIELRQALFENSRKN
jgi:hypothetical protein